MEKSLFSREYKVLLKLLKVARTEARITQQEVAQSMKVTQSFVSKCERGERRLDLVELRAWCKALGVSFPIFVRHFESATHKET